MKVAVLDGKHPGPINALQFNPRYMMFASACTNMVRSITPHHHFSAVATAGNISMNKVVISYFSLGRPFGSPVLMTYRQALPKCCTLYHSPAAMLNAFRT